MKSKLLEICPFKTTKTSKIGNYQLRLRLSRPLHSPTVKFVEIRSFQGHFTLPRWKVWKLQSLFKTIRSSWGKLLKITSPHSANMRIVKTQYFQDYHIFPKWNYPKSMFSWPPYHPKIKLTSWGNQYCDQPRQYEKVSPGVGTLIGGFHLWLGVHLQSEVSLPHNQRSSPHKLTAPHLQL